MKTCKHPSYKMEADFSADPFWCKVCGENLDSEDFHLSGNLQQRLVQWIEEYGAWIDLKTDNLKDNGLILEEEHNKKGKQLFQEVLKERGREILIVFIPSKTAENYS